VKIYSCQNFGTGSAGSAEAGMILRIDGFVVDVTNKNRPVVKRGRKSS
jgi:hypothetical protein